MRILYLTFYFEPDIGPGAFRNTALVDELARQLPTGSHIHVVTAQPNRYQSFKPVAPEREENQNSACSVLIERVTIPTHASGFQDQIRSFWVYFLAVHRLTKNKEYDLIVASSSRLFTAFLGARLARKRTIPLFLDIRDLFREAILDVLNAPLLRVILDPTLRAVERYTFGYASHINLVSEGYRSYFRKFPKAAYSFFTNGIDNVFLDIPASEPVLHRPYKTILYAGNIGEGQGLHKLIPEATRQLGDRYHFVIIGDGGAKRKLEMALNLQHITNVELRPPVSQQELVNEYQRADYLLVHLNDINVCTRVLPSKLFDYGATDKPILAGVAGYAATFVRDHLPNSIVFNPGDVDELVKQLRETPYCTQVRADFKTQFQRKTICQEMARHIIKTLSS